MATLRHLALCCACFLVPFGWLKAQWTFEISQQVGGGCQRVDASDFATANAGFLGGCTAFSYVFGAPRIRKTTDGGNVWTTVYSGTAGMIADIEIVDANVRVASVIADQSALVLRSTDGGNTWVTVDDGTNTPSGVAGFHFPTASLGFAVGGYDDIARTTDGGATWTMLPDPVPGVSQQLDGVFFTSTTEGYAVGGNQFGGSTGKIYHTTDQGETWDTLSYMPKCYFKGVIFTSPSVGFAYGNGTNDLAAQILRTNDGGQTWAPMTIISPDTSGITDIQFANANVGFATDLNANILRTNDGGLTWQLDYAASGSAISLYTLSLAGNKGYAFGYSTYFIETGTVPIGVEEFVPGLSFSVWPNPIGRDDHRLRIACGVPWKGRVRLEVLDLLGSIVASGVIDLSTGKASFPLDGMRMRSAGQYFVRLTSESSSVVQKIVLE